jgi:hypothetical protein
MARIEIYIDGIKADLPEKDLNLNLTFALKDRNGIAINSGSRSEYSFDLPATKQNDYIFSRFHDVGEVTFSKQDLLPAIIIVDGLPFFEGRAQVRSVTTQQDRFYWKGLSYKVSFYGNNVDWVADLKNKYIYELDFGNITLGTTANYLNYLNSYPASTFCTLPMKFQDWDVPGQIDPYKEFYPALFIRGIVDKAYSAIGYTVISNFLDTQWFKGLTLPIPFDITRGIVSEELSNNYINFTCLEPLNPTMYSIPPPVGPAPVTPIPISTYTNPVLTTPWNPATYIYTVPVDGYYIVSSYLKVTIGVPGDQFIIWGGVCTGVNYLTPVPGTEYQFGGIYAGGNVNVDIINESPVQFYTAGTQLSQYLLNLGDPSVLYSYGFTVIGELLISDPTTIDLKYFINTQWKQLDLIKGLAHLFNLTFETNVALKTVTIEPADNYVYTYPGANNIEQGFYNKTFSDLTRKVDLNVKGELFNIDDFERSIQFIYKEDSNDPTVEALNQGQNVPMAGAQFNFPVTRLKDGLQDIENPFFSPTLFLLSNDVTDGTSQTRFYVPFIWPENYLETPTATQGNYDVAPRILYHNGFLSPTPQAPQIIIKNPFGGGTLVVNAVEVFMQNYNTPGVYQSLVFGSETINGVYVKGLLERFYLAEMIRRMYGKQMEVYMFWDVLMLNNLTFRNTVQIHGDNYILNEINSFSVVNQRSTKTYLTYDAKGDGTEVNNIENTAILTKYIP